MTSILPGWQRGCLDVCALANCCIYALTGRAPGGHIRRVSGRVIHWVAWYGHDRTSSCDVGFDSFCERTCRQLAAMLGLRMYDGFYETKYSATRAFIIREREKLRVRQTAWFKTFLAGPLARSFGIQSTEAEVVWETTTGDELDPLKDNPTCTLLEMQEMIQNDEPLTVFKPVTGGKSECMDPWNQGVEKAMSKIKTATIGRDSVIVEGVSEGDKVVMTLKTGTKIPGVYGGKPPGQHHQHQTALWIGDEGHTLIVDTSAIDHIRPGSDRPISCGRVFVRPGVCKLLDQALAEKDQTQKLLKLLADAILNSRRK